MSGEQIQIHYLRPPDREEVFVQRLVERAPDGIVTLMERTRLKRPMIVDGETVFEDGAPAVWFTFPGARHDIGRFHRADGAFTGLYANIVTPVVFRTPHVWSMTDLFLDVWVGASGEPRLLDEDELEDALAQGWIDNETADAARSEAERLVDAARRGTWPPPVVYDWTLERARARPG